MELATYFLLVSVFTLYLSAHLVSLFLSASINFLLSRYYVFRYKQKKSLRSQLILFSFTVLITAGISTVMFEWVRTIYPHYIAKYSAIGVSIAVNFILKRFIVFNRQHEKIAD